MPNKNKHNKSINPKYQATNIKKSKKNLTRNCRITLLLIVKCGSNTQPENTNQKANQPAENKKNLADKGIGPFKEMKLTYPLDEEMATQGLFIYKTKCIACHKRSTEKLIGPGWKGITERRASEWIMNFITNTDVMLDKDLVAQQLLVVCVSRMPKQNLNAEEARNILEFMRKNDGKH